MRRLRLRLLELAKPAAKTMPKNIADSSVRQPSAHSKSRRSTSELRQTGNKSLSGKTSAGPHASLRDDYLFRVYIKG